MAISKFLSDDFGEKIGVGGGAVALQSFWSLKKGTKTFNFHSNAPSPDLLGSLFQYDQPWEEETNKRASVICFLAKIAKFHIFVYRSLKLLQ